VDRGGRTLETRAEVSRECQGPARWPRPTHPILGCVVSPRG
jgi:hypothetical protein